MVIIGMGALTVEYTEAHQSWPLALRDPSWGAAELGGCYTPSATSWECLWGSSWAQCIWSTACVNRTVVHLHSLCSKNQIRGQKNKVFLPWATFQRAVNRALNGGTWVAFTTDRLCVMPTMSAGLGVPWSREGFFTSSCLLSFS